MQRILRRLVDVKPGEGRAVAYAFGYFFCVLASYYVLRPLREAMGIVGHVKDLSRLFLVTLAATFALTPVLAALVSRWPPRRFVPIVYRFFALNLVVFYVFLRGPHVDTNVARVFFVWTSVFNLFALSLFWGVIADLFEREQGLRLFGLVGGGGTLGAMAGSFTTASLAERVGVAPLVLVSAVLLELAVQLVRRLVGLFGDREASTAAPEQALEEGGIVRWLPSLLANPYLLAIVGYMLLFTFTSTSAYFEQARIVQSAIGTNAARTALFARMDLVVNILSFALQSLLVGPLLRRLGIGLTLAILPLLSRVGFVLLGVAPTLAVIVCFQVVRRAADYGIAKPSREVLFTTVRRHDKYKAKSFIDTFVYRAGDAIGALAVGTFASSTTATILSIGVCVVWSGVAIVLGRMQRTLPSL